MSPVARRAERLALRRRDRLVRDLEQAYMRLEQANTRGDADAVDRAKAGVAELTTKIRSIPPPLAPEVTSRGDAEWRAAMLQMADLAPAVRLSDGTWHSFQQGSALAAILRRRIAEQVAALRWRAPEPRISSIPPPLSIADVHLCIAAPHGPTAAGVMLAAA